MFSIYTNGVATDSGNRAKMCKTFSADVAAVMRELARGAVPTPISIELAKGKYLVCQFNVLSYSGGISK